MAPLLKPFQHEGAQFLAARTRALLADEPGVGKTAQVITACKSVGAQRVQVVCPSIAVQHWRRECSKWGLFRPQCDVRVCSWDDAHDLAKDLGKPRPMWDVLVVDECHFGKNAQARRTKAVFGTGGLGWYAKRIWALSGTPAPNAVSELWPLLRAFGKTAMDFETFRNYFCVIDQNGKVRGNRPDHIEELRAILKSIALRRLKKDVLPELGEIDVQDWYVKPDARFITRLGDLPMANDLALRSRLEQMSDDEVMSFLADPTEDFSTLRRYNALLKAPAVFDTVKFEHENGLLDKVIVFGYHKEALAALQRAFERAGISSVLIYGDTPREERDGLIEHWKKRGVVILASVIIASTAIDLTAAHQVIALEMDWVPGNNWQAWQRPHRHGQENTVTVRVAHGTPIDEIVNSVVMRKTKDIAEIFS